ncbi:hypothetical protein AYI70_g9649 [Smittium culicis]|uniref:Uncharacterized protein n=1 Tax=Smittium culicis TaxID=133412 RepID=A0A1R1XA85_9FUNG|nr:hypothetical protein AYI70_g9649 [Smittium culicis]
MGIDGAPIRRSNSESTILEGPFEEMEWSFVPAGNPRNQDIHRCERYSLGKRKKIRCNYLIQTSQNCVTPVGALPEDEYQASSHV